MKEGRDHVPAKERSTVLTQSNLTDSSNWLRVDKKYPHRIREFGIMRRSSPGRDEQKDCRSALHFSAARRMAKTSLDLINLDYELGESLWSFLTRFNRACLEIPYVQVEKAISALVRTVRDEAYVRSLTKKCPKTMGELYARGDKFMQSVDMIKARAPREELREICLHQIRSNEKLKEEVIKEGRNNLVRRLTRVQSLEVGNRDILKWPKKMRAPTAKHTSNKYCLFHKDHGHDVEGCRHLKDEIEGLIRRGYLK
ncbi:uncharacterized protein LOC119981861 [Tripterygium wilfordii]|uniref:uncharacterized protein LOC119981861 n=1 Tax=Tripterygium wilfordii TaxID=458696 RepID=UPI0018F80E7C|nr:uncharacterized protein LOC119981861 [Tripterygium wilfordii]